MKTIQIDYDEYKKENNEFQRIGEHKGIDDALTGVLSHLEDSGYIPFRVKDHPLFSRLVRKMELIKLMEKQSENT